MLIKTLKTLLLAVLGGFAFEALNIPLPWMLGPLAVVMIFTSVLKQAVCWPEGLRNIALIALGYTMGIPFTLTTAIQIIYQLPTMMLATASTVGFSILLAFFTARRAGINLSTSIIGSIPGGLTQMVILSEEFETADVTTVTFLQTMRMLSVVFIVPFLALHGMAGGNAALPAQSTAAAGSFSAEPATWLLFIIGAVIGSWAAVRFRFPTPYLLGPLLATALLVLAGFQAQRLPPPIIVCAQLSVGIFMGVSMNPHGLTNWKKLLPFALLGSFGIVLYSLVLGYFLTLLHPIGLATAFLSTAPGGITEMGITAVTVQADVSMVSAYQMFRLLFILLVVPLILRRYLGRPAGA